MGAGPIGDHAFATLEPERFWAGDRAGVHAQSPKSPERPLARARREVITVLLVGVGYYVGSLFGLQARFPGSGSISIFWPANALLLAALLLAPLRMWPLYLLVVLPAHLHVVSVFQRDVPLITMMCQYAGNVIQAVVAALTVRRFVGNPPVLDRLGRVATYIALAALFAPAVASSLVAWLFHLTGWVDDYWVTLQRRFLTNVVPSLTIPPLILMVASRRTVVGHRDSWLHYAEFAAVMAGLLAVQVIVFGEPAAGPRTAALVYAPLPLLLWAAVRFGIGGMCLSLLVFGFLSLSAAIAGKGPFTGRSPEENAFSLQIFLIASSIPLMLLAALVEERRRSEIALRESQQRYGLATAAGGVGVWELNLETNAVYVDSVLNGMLGFDAADIGDYLDDWQRLTPPEDFERAMSQVRAVLAAEVDSIEFESRMIHKDGSVRWFLVRGAIEGEDGKRLVGTSTDITRRKRAEEQAQMKVEEARVLSSQLAHLNRVVTVGELATTLAHEITQPLTGVLSNAEAALLLLNTTEPDWKEVRAALSDIVEDDHRATKIIDRMRALLRRETPSHSLLDMRATVEGVIPLVHSDVLMRGILLETHLGSDLPLVMGDQTQLQQVLLNLLLNAFDAVSEAHRVHAHVVLGVERVGDRVVVSVVDNGVGLSDDQLPSVFKPFFTTKPTGIGLGLSICRTIVASHGGFLEARRIGDEGGMSFSFSLPSAAAQ